MPRRHRFQLAGRSRTTRPLTALLNEAYLERRRHPGGLHRGYDPQLDDLLRQLREGSGASDFDRTEWRVVEEKVDLTFVYPNHDIELPTEAERARLPPAVRRNLRNYKQTPPDVLLSRAPAVAPRPSLPNPYDDEPEWGFRDKYMYRPKLSPGEEAEKRARGKRKRSDKRDSDARRTPKRPRAAPEQPATEEHGAVPDTSDSPLTPPHTPSCDTPIPSIEEDNPEDVAQTELSLLHLAQCTAAQSVSPPGSPAAPLTPTRAATPPGPGPPTFAANGFLALPQTVRLQVYRALLLRPEPIRVHAS